MATTTKLSEIIFQGGTHYRTDQFGSTRPGGRRHEGTDYGTNSQRIPVYCPFNNGVVTRTVNTETVGNQRGCLVEIQWANLNLGMIMQHLTEGSVAVATGDTVNQFDLLGRVGMTGLDSNGNPVSTGIHLHVEVYYLNSGVRFNFESLDYDKINGGGGGLPPVPGDTEKKGVLQNMSLQELEKLIEDKLNQAIKPNTKEPSEWAKVAWEDETKAGITDGTNPQNLATREEVVSMLDRATRKILAYIAIEKGYTLSSGVNKEETNV